MAKRRNASERKLAWYGVDAVFKDGRHVTLKEFKREQEAISWIVANRARDFYCGRPYKLEIVPFDPETYRDREFP